ncbi:MAG: autotransporter-associated beta strand repeat-containing protein, partial [Planctomycetia bacterium]|nr:autotransporter-associated beta strand repeat-containing protein [Planctomycetia bacterium]
TTSSVVDVANETTLQMQNLTGAGSLTKTGLGTLTLSGTNDYAGGTTVSGGILSISSDENLGASTGALTLSGGTLKTTADVVLGTRPVTFTTSSVVDVANETTLQMQNLTGAADQTLTKNGAGRLDISGTLSVGNLTIQAGTFSPGNSIGTTTLSAGNFSLAENATLLFEMGTFGDTFTVDTLSVTGEISFAEGSSIAFLLDGALPASNASYTLASATEDIMYGTFNWRAIFIAAGMNPDNWSVTADTKRLLLNYRTDVPGNGVPEPSTYLLLLFGGA